MSNEERLRIMRKCDDMEERFRPIYVVSMVVFFLEFIVVMLVDELHYIFIATFFITAGVVGISLIVLFVSHFLYKKLLKELMQINNINPTVLIQEPVKKYTINYVMEGKYKNEKITAGSLLYTDSSPFSKRYISSYTVIDETTKDEYSVWKGALGATLFGDMGAVAGIGGKKKKEYLVQIDWKDGEKSLICIDDEYYKVLVQSMF